MILELVDIRIQPGQQAAFDEAIQLGVNTVIAKAKGFQGFKINRGIESPSAICCKFFGPRLKTTPWTSVSPLPLASGAPS